jgi:cytochrome c
VLCLKDCPVGKDGSVHVVSSIPEHARDAHGNLAEQNRTFGPVRGVVIAKAAPARALPVAADARTLAGSNNCLACHDMDRKIVGPSFNEIAARYKGDANAASRLAAKVKDGGSGTWGNVPMPPHADMKSEDIQVLVRWVLAGGARN